MAGELQYYGHPSTESGLTVTARVYDSSGAQTGSDVSCTETGTLAIYIGTMPTAAAGAYGIRFFDSADTLLGQGPLFWDGTNETTAQTLAATLALLETEADAATRAATNQSEHDATQATLAALPVPLTAAEVNAEVDTALADYDAPTKAELDTAEAAVIAALPAAAPTAAVVASQVRVELTAELAHLDADVSSRASQTTADADHDATQAAVAGLASPLDAAGVRAAVGLASANLDTQLAALPTDADVQTAAGAAITAAEPVSANLTQVAGVAVSGASDLQADTSALATAADLAVVDSNVDALLLDVAALASPLDAAGVRSAVGLASANLDTQLSGLSTFDPAADVVARVTLVDTTTANTDMRGTDLALLAASFTASPSAADIYAEFTSGSNEDAFKADVSSLVTVLANQDVINAGVKLASLLIPHSTDVA